jgi:2-isopropylmalate synthase
MLKDQRTYEIMTPESVGLAKTRLVLGKHSGRHAFRVRLEEMGFTPDDATLQTAFKRFKALADRKKVVTDSDLRALLRGDLGTPQEHYRLASLQVSCGPPSAATATVTLHTPTGEEQVGADTGSGSVDAVFRAIRKIIGSDDMLVDFKIQNVTEGIDALGEVSVRISPRDDPDTTHYGYGADTDIVVASARAYLAAINRKLAASGFEAPSPLADRPRIAVTASAETDEPFDPHYTAGI